MRTLMQSKRCILISFVATIFVPLAFLAIYSSYSWISKANVPLCHSVRLEHVPVSAKISYGSDVSILSDEAVASARAGQLTRLSSTFRSYNGIRHRTPSLPTFIVTNATKASTIRFYDTSPFSPTGRFLAVFQFPDGAEGKAVVPGQEGHVAVVDLLTGEERVVASSRGWDSQVGAHVQWGADDSTLFFNDAVRYSELVKARPQILQRSPPQEDETVRANDVRFGSDFAQFYSPKDTSRSQPHSDYWIPVGVKLDLNTGTKHFLEGTVYQVSPDGKWAISPCLRRILHTQRGYGIWLPSHKHARGEEDRPLNHGASKSDGLHITDTTTGDCRLLVSFDTINRRVALPAAPSLYGFHAKFDPSGGKVMFIVRTRAAAGSSRLDVANGNHIIVMDLATQQLRKVLSWSYSFRDGSHPTFTPDGQSLIMNLQFPKLLAPASPVAVVLCDASADEASLHARSGAQLSEDTTDLLPTHCKLVSDCGTGHPSVLKDTHLAITDAYPKECTIFRGLEKPGAVPLRLINMDTHREVELLQVMSTASDELGGTNRRSRDSMAWRSDMHPCFHPSNKWIAFNGRPDGGHRQVLISYLGELSLGQGPMVDLLK